MKKSISILTFAFLLAGGMAVSSSSAYGGNRNIELALQSYGDLSRFYQALLTTGVVNQLSENQNYTIFAPTDTALASIGQQAYPCFYSVNCRPQIATFLHNHILVGRYDLPELVTYGQGIQTGGVKRIHVSEPFVGDYAVEGARILSKTEIDGSIIYRIDEVLAAPNELVPFQTVSVVPSVPPGTVTTTVTRKTYYPTTTVVPSAESTVVIPDADTTKTTTIIRNYGPVTY